MPRALFFSDSFADNSISTAWTTISADKEAYAFDNGALLVDAKQGGLNEGPNALHLTKQTLKGDWDISADIRPYFSSDGDRFQIGVFGGGSDWLVATLYLSEHPTTLLNLSISKTGEEEPKVWVGNPVSADAIIIAMKEKGCIVTLSKRGRKYYASVSSSVLGRSISTSYLNIFRFEGYPAIAATRSRATSRSTMVYIDEFTIKRIN